MTLQDTIAALQAENAEVRSQLRRAQAALTAEREHSKLMHALVCAQSTAMRQALEALEKALTNDLRPYDAAKTIDALREALGEKA
mgnify:CR=1 FL=1